MNLNFFFNRAVWLLPMIFILTVEKGFAVTANPHPVIRTQPDGTTITILLHGDEYIHWTTTSDGYTIMTNVSGVFEYAMLQADGKLVFSGIKAHNIEKRNADELAFLQKIKPGLFFSEAQMDEMKQLLKGTKSPDAPLMGGFPTTGERNLLMILANFSNTTTTFSQNDFSNYMNQVNYNGTGSFKDFFIEVSYGLLSVTTSVTVWVTVPHVHDYYGPGNKWGEFAYDAVVAANNQTSVNFADYDNNTDGVVDGVAIIHQGRGQEESGNTNDIWSHSWSLSAAGYSEGQRTFDEILVDAYTTMPEKNGGSMGTIGVMCHEFGHNLGAPDFYDTDYETGGQYNGTGNWDLMAGGSWNGNSGTKPAHPNAWIKNYFTWTDPPVLSSQGTVTLRNSAVYADAIRYNTTTDNEYFLCENRQQTGFDAGIPGHGLIVYHVDGDFIEAHHYSNDINASAHQGMFPVAANSPTSNGINPAGSSTINTGGCPFPGISEKTSYTDLTFPDSKSWAGDNTGKPLINIVENAASQEIDLCFMVCASPEDPVNFSANTINFTQIDLNWANNPAVDPVMVVFNTIPSFGIPVNGTVYLAGASINGGGTVIYNGTNMAFSHMGLQPSTHYYYKAYSVMTGNNYSSGVITDATTQCQAISVLPFSERFELTADVPSCWSEGPPNPAWTFVEGNGSGTGSGHPASAHSGVRNACLRDFSIIDNQTMLISPVFDLSSYTTVALKFWLYMAKWGTKQDKLSVFYHLDPALPWVKLVEFDQNYTEWTELTVPFPEISDQFQFAFEGNAKNGYGVCIDDVLIADPSTVAINDHQRDEMQIFPNPGPGIFMVTPGISKIRKVIINIQDLNGRCILEKDFLGENQYKIDISDANPGLYILTIKTEGLVFKRKLEIIR